jgi:hypothetical protein
VRVHLPAGNGEDLPLLRRDRQVKGAGTSPESDAYLKANDRVIEAEKALPWWQRI